VSKPGYLPNSERFEVRHCPEAGRYETQVFVSKGLAFAYARRKAARNCEPTVTVERQGMDDAPVDRWTFHKSGDVDHIRL
jgi:hypothetical protein